MEILKYIDVLLGLALVMVLASTVVTAVTQIIITSTFARSRYLRDGVADLVRQLEPSLETHARYIAELVLRHPMVSRPNSALGFITSRIRNFGRTAGALAWLRRFIPQTFTGGTLPNTNPATVIQREELIRILLEWAANEGLLAEFANRPDAPPELKAATDALVAAMGNNGVSEPGDVLHKIRTQLLAEEQANPQLATTECHSRAILTSSVNDFTGKIFSWYDNTMQRISDHFTLEAKLWTSVIALLVVLAIQLDSVQLLKRLSADDAYRQSLVDQAKELDARLDTNTKDMSDPQSLAEIKTRIEEQHAEIDSSLSTLRSPSLAVIPDHLVWQGVEQVRFDPKKYSLPTGKTHTLKITAGTGVTTVGFQNDPLTEIRLGLAANPNFRVYNENGGLRIAAASAATPGMKLTLDQNDIAGSERKADFGPLWTSLPGLLLSWILLSLGTPFWFDALKNLLKFRSVLAQKEDVERPSTKAQAPSPPEKKQAAGASAGG